MISPETARALRTMLKAVTQDGGTADQRGTGHAAAIPGYQVAGKTGTAQQVDPACGCYSASTTGSRSPGMLPAQDPRYVVAIMLDAPQGGTSAAPLFHDIGSYLAQREKLPVSPDPAPEQTLVVPTPSPRPAPAAAPAPTAPARRTPLTASPRPPGRVGVLQAAVGARPAEMRTRPARRGTRGARTQTRRVGTQSSACQNGDSRREAGPVRAWGGGRA